MDTFPYLGFWITEYGKCTMEFRTSLNGAGGWELTSENMEKIPEYRFQRRYN